MHSYQFNMYIHNAVFEFLKNGIVFILPYLLFSRIFGKCVFCVMSVCGSFSEYLAHLHLKILSLLCVYSRDIFIPQNFSFLCFSLNILCKMCYVGNTTQSHVSLTCVSTVFTAIYHLLSFYFLTKSVTSLSHTFYSNHFE